MTGRDVEVVNYLNANEVVKLGLFGPSGLGSKYHFKVWGKGMSIIVNGQYYFID